MIDKPDGCKSCPLWGTGKGFVRGVFPPGARLLVYGQNPGSDEEGEGIPLIGKTGQMLDDIYLPLTGEDVVAKDNVLRCRYMGSNNLPTGRTLQEAMVYCEQYDNIPDSIELIVAMGKLALAKFGPGLNQNEWAGHLLPRKDDK